ncbi:MAG TPA: hypothetical protein VKV15_04410 [Bryobacteraceae bacterium]|nr:hypothetical protein [Bryobacteraceae bacterium]
MGRLGFLLKTVVALFLILCAFLCLTLVAGQIEQHMFRRRAKRLLGELQALELRKTPWPDALQQFQHWGRAAKLQVPCNQHQCSFNITLVEYAYTLASHTGFLPHLDDYLRWRFKLSYDYGPFDRAESAILHGYMMAGGRPSIVIATLGMRDGIVWSKGFSVGIQTYWHDLPDAESKGWFDFALEAESHSVSRFARYSAEGPQVLLHPDYEIGRPGGCLGCVEGWALFTPYADPATVRRLMEFDLSCLTRIRPCLTQRDIMPVVWRQYLEEQSRADSLLDQPICSSTVIETLGRDAPNVVSGEIIAQSKNGNGSNVHFKLLDKLKGAVKWEVGNNYEMYVPVAAPQLISRNGRFVFFFDDPNLVTNGQEDRGWGCSPLPLNESNLTLVRRGIEMDFGAADRGQ